MDWNIKRRSDACSITGKPFEKDELFYTLLFQGKEGIERQDLCEQAWNERNDNIRPLSFWRSAFKPAPPPEPEPVQKADAEAELRRLLEQNNPDNDKLCCLLALLLERKRILRIRERTHMDGKAIILYEHTDTQETMVVPEVEFDLFDLDNLQRELAKKSLIFGSPENNASPTQQPIP